MYNNVFSAQLIKQTFIYSSVYRYSMNREEFSKLDAEGIEKFKREQVAKLKAENLASMDPETREKSRLMDLVKNPEGWKEPTIPFVTKSEKEANAMVDAISYFAGGAELSQVGDKITVTSLGYYHYIGA